MATVSWIVLYYAIIEASYISTIAHDTAWKTMPARPDTGGYSNIIDIMRAMILLTLYECIV